VRGLLSRLGRSAAVSSNKQIIETLEATEPSKLGPLLADDVEWVEWADGVPASGSIKRGKEAYIGNYGDDELRGTVARMIEENNTVVVEGTVLVKKKDGQRFHVRYCDIYELAHGQVKRKSSYGALLKDSA
jgi:ketosteroid isomerase-like protein